MNNKQMDWELLAQLTYDALDKGDILELLKQVKDVYEVTPEETPYRDKVYGIAKEVAQARRLTFKQWKCLNAYVYRNTRLESNYKTF